MKNNTKLVLGLIFMAIGVLLLAENFNMFFFNIDFFSWHTVFLVIGIILLANKTNNTLGIIFVLIGLWGLSKHILGDLFGIYFSDLWPLILFGAGLWLILSMRSKPEPVKSAETPNFNFTNMGNNTSSVYSDDIIDDTTILSGNKKVILSQNFKGGKAATLFGGYDLDLTQAKLAPGENILEITTMFGGTEIRVPRDFKVIVSVASIFGGFEDKRYINFDAPSSDSILVIRGTVAFGGGELMN